MAKTVIIPETTFTANALGFYGFDGVKTSEDKINVFFDGVIYSNIAKNTIDYDGTSYITYGDFDNEMIASFDAYPFALASEEVPDSVYGWSTQVYVPDQNEHTIEVYVEDDAPVVTKKINNTQILQLDERLIIFDETTGDVVTFDGENWLSSSDNFGEAIMPSKYAVVGTAIVGKDIVGPSVGTD